MEEREQATEEVRQAEKAYDILLARHVSEDRILAERASFLVLASSFLFVGFVSLPVSVPKVQILRLALPVFGILLSLVGSMISLFSFEALRHFVRKELEMEARGGGVFDYMARLGIEPNADRRPGAPLIRNISFRIIMVVFLPGLLVVLWGIALFWAIRLPV